MTSTVRIYLGTKKNWKSGSWIKKKVQRVLTAFNVKHTGLMREQTVKVSTKVKPFSEIIRFEVYENILNN